MKTITVDVAIIGSGTAGMSAYRAAKHHTGRVVLIESHRYGTTCARVGCMPSKLLIAAADSAHRARQAPLFGIHTGPVRVDGAEVMQRVRSERDRFVGFVLDAVDGWPATDKLRGHAHFAGPNELLIDDHTRVTAARIVIATGSTPYIPDGWREALGDRLLTNDDVFDWRTLPASVVVVGGGVIALELAQALDRLDVRVRVLARNHRLGPLTDPALAASALNIFTRELSVVRDAGAIRFVRNGTQAEVAYLEEGVARTEMYDFVLAAMGRTPQLAGLNLPAAGVALDARGMPPFDHETGQIGDSSIFIAGDVSSAHPLLHEAADDGRIAGDNAGRFPDVRVRPRRTPLAIVFTEPQMMIAGASFRSLQQAGTEFEVGEVDFGDQGRSRVMAQNRGLLHVYGAHHTGRFLGAEMIGPAAEHIGHLLSWAAQQQLTVQQMLDSPYYHPVIEEGVRTALRDLSRRLRLGPMPVERCLDCGPGA